MIANPAKSRRVSAMPSRFRLPTVSRRHFSLILSILVLAIGATYLMDRAQQSPQPIAPEALQSFRNDCARVARHANGGGDLVMDDATEERIGAYCGCMAEAIESNVAPTEIEKIGRGQASDQTVQLLSRIAEGCKPQLE
jgi:hypothetical protein